jgi:hypothetical protein
MPCRQLSHHDVQELRTIAVAWRKTIARRAVSECRGLVRPLAQRPGRPCRPRKDGR